MVSDPPPPLDPATIRALLAHGYAFEIYADPDHVDVRRPDGSLAFRIPRKGSPPAAFDALIDQLYSLRPSRGGTDA